MLQAVVQYPQGERLRAGDGLRACRAVSQHAGEFWHFGRQVIDHCTPGSPAVLPMPDFLDFLSKWEPPAVRVDGGSDYTLLADDEYYTKDVGPRTEFRSQADLVHGRLGNEESRRAYATAFEGTPDDVWKHYVSSVFTKTQYGQYVNVEPGNCALSIGIDEGMELP